LKRGGGKEGGKNRNTRLVFMGGEKNKRGEKNQRGGGYSIMQGKLLPLIIGIRVKIKAKSKR